MVLEVREDPEASLRYLSALEEGEGDVNRLTDTLQR